MTNTELEAIRRIKGFDDSGVGYAAARMVLVEGKRNVDAADLLGCTTSTVSAAVKLYRKADGIIRAAYCKA